MATNNILSFGSVNAPNTTSTSGFNNKALKACRPVIANALPKCFVFLDGLDDILFKLADNATSNQEQEEYFIAMRHFRVNREHLKKEFTKLVLSDYDQFCSSTNNVDKKDNASATTNPELSILDNELLEEDIAVNRIAMKSENLFREDFNKLNKRFAHALGVKKITGNPLSPERVAKNLKEVIAPQTSNLEIKLVAYKQFEQQAVTELGQLCKQLNSVLGKQGILPNLNQTAGQQSSRQTADGYPDHKTDIENLDLADYDLEDGESEIDPAQLFEGLRQLLNKPQSRKNSTAPIANQTALLNALSNLQQTNTNPTSVASSNEFLLPDLRQSVLDNLTLAQQDGSLTQHAISPADEDAMDVIDMLFEFILEDDAIPAPIRATLARLQIPMLKIALSDKQVFSKKNHPARRLLNNLAKASTGWSQQNEELQDKLQNKIETTVNTVLTEFENDIQLFSTLDTEFNEFVQQQNRSSQAAEQRIVQANKGREKLISAQHDVDDTINQLLSEHDQLPKVVLAIINDGWKHVLKLRLLQKGKNSKEWKESVELAQQLMWSVTPKLNESERKELLGVIPGMLKSLREGLSGASFNQHKITALFKDLQECHIKCMNGSEIVEDDLQIIDNSVLLSSPKPDLETLPTLDEKEKLLTDDVAMLKAKQLDVGTWLEIDNQTEEPPKRIKFSWRSNLTGKCLFVTYNGAKAADVSITEVASWFQQGKAQIIDQSSQLMDRALVSMMETVND